MSVRQVLALTLARLHAPTLLTALGLTGLLAGCSLPPMPERTPSHAISAEASAQTHLGQALAPLQQQHPNLTGIYPLADAYAAQNAMRQHAKQATTMICLATQLHSIAAGNMTPAYQAIDGSVRPVFLYSVDVSEFAVNKLKDRGSLEVTSIVTNIQDFLVHIQRELV